MLCISAAYAVMRCLSVCVSVTFMDCVKTSNRTGILRLFSPSGSHTILVFPYQTGWRYSDGNHPNGGVECRWGRQKSRFWACIWLQCLLLMLQQARCCQHGRRWTTATVPKLMTLTSLVTYCGYAGIRPLSTMHDNQSPSPWFYSARSTKCGLALYTITVDHESCVWQQGLMLRRRQQNRIELYAA